MTERRWSWSAYLIRRGVRLWIVLVPAVLLGSAIDLLGIKIFGGAASIFDSPSQQGYVVGDLISTITNFKTVLGNIFFLQGLFVPLIGTNVALWSLAYEFWYYIMFPLCLLALLPDMPALKRLLCATAVIGIAILLGGHGAFLFLVWLFGAIVAGLPRRISDIVAGRIFWYGSIFFVGALLLTKKASVPLSVGELTVGLLTALMIYVAKCDTSTYKRSTFTNVSGFFSDISYTLYVTHLPIAIFVCGFFNTPWRLRPLGVDSLQMFLTTAAIAIAWAFVLYVLFEARTDKVRAIVSNALRRS